MRCKTRLPQDKQMSGAAGVSKSGVGAFLLSKTQIALITFH